MARRGEKAPADNCALAAAFGAELGAKAGSNCAIPFLVRVGKGSKYLSVS